MLILTHFRIRKSALPSEIASTLLLLTGLTGSRPPRSCLASIINGGYRFPSDLASSELHLHRLVFDRDDPNRSARSFFFFAFFSYFCFFCWFSFLFSFSRYRAGSPSSQTPAVTSAPDRSLRHRRPVHRYPFRGLWAKQRTPIRLGPRTYRDRVAGMSVRSVCVAGRVKLLRRTHIYVCLLVITYAVVNASQCEQHLHIGARSQYRRVRNTRWPFSLQRRVTVRSVL